MSDRSPPASAARGRVEAPAGSRHRRRPARSRGGQPPIPAPPKTVNVFVDGREVEADARDNLIEAARRIGVDIPYFCYHPRLSIAAQCRMCLVETSDAPGRLVPGCQVRVKEGLKIVTDLAGGEGQPARGRWSSTCSTTRSTAPSATRAGECKLQDYYMEYDHQPSRIDVLKLAKPKREMLRPPGGLRRRALHPVHALRPLHGRDREGAPARRWCSGASHSLIATFPGQPLDSKYSGNTVDICPVGALLNRDFRFQSRVWFVNQSPSVCTGCSNGCNVYVESRGNVVYRLLPRRNEEVNQVWMCDEGRLTYHATNEKRIRWARTGRGENAASVGPRIAVERAAEILRPLAGQGSVGIALSAQCTNEEATAAFQIGKQLRASRYFVGAHPPGDSDDFLIRPDKNPNTRGVQLVAEAFGVTLEDASGIDGVKALVAMRTDGLPAEKLAAMEVFIAIAQNEDAAASEADVTLPCESVYEQDGTLINWYGRLQRTWDSLPAKVGDAAPGWSWAKRLLDGLGGVGPTTAAEAFRTLAEKSPHLAGLSFAELPDDGIVIEALLPSQWPARAPRPVPSAHSVRGPQTTPPGMKVGDEASGGSR